MITGTTSSGFKYEISEDTLKDWRFIEPLSRLKGLEEDSESSELDFINIMSEIQRVLFKDKGKALMKHIASGNDGKVPTDVFLAELLEIIKHNDETKNS